ncbi:hypothetical protein PP549_27095, partial [Mycobacteroides abscessus]|nr:hypothetical protein [Mycobacteroides abscessus]
RAPLPQPGAKADSTIGHSRTVAHDASSRCSRPLGRSWGNVGRKGVVALMMRAAPGSGCARALSRHYACLIGSVWFRVVPYGKTWDMK